MQNNKPGQTVEVANNYIWHVTEGMEALGTWLDSRGCSEASMWHKMSKANVHVLCEEGPVL